MLTAVLAGAVLILLGCVLVLLRTARAAARGAPADQPSREYFERYLRTCVARAARRPSYSFGVLRLEVRGIAALRRSIGRAPLEAILADFADRVLGVIRPTDVFTRLDDDNFAIILDDLRRVTDITRIASRVQQSMADAAALALRQMPLEVRIGIATSRPGERVEAAALIAEAETALRRSVDTGRPFVLLDDRLDAAARGERTLESELSLAVDDGQFSLVLQPLVASDTRQLLGFTAFAQWMHPTRGVLRANDWIALAESSDQMVRIGQWVVGAAVRTLKQLTEAAGRPLLLTFNVAASEVERGELPQNFADALAGEPSLGPMLRIELPNTLFADPSPAVTAVAAKLRELGVGIHIDHASAGSVALWRSLKLGVRGVRLNLSEIDATDAPVLAHLLAASRQIADEVVVEGIESLEDDRVVRDLTPPVFAQGYQIARPMPVQRAIDLARGKEPLTVRAAS